MVCKKCITIVWEELEKLGIKISSITLGRVSASYFDKDISIKKIRDALEKNGFELLLDRDAKLIEQIKKFIINLIQYREVAISDNSKYSDLLENEFKIKYKEISYLFASIENISIEYFIVKQKIANAKELLKYEKLNLREISIKLGFSSVQNLSFHFKTMTGFTASQFKSLVTEI